MGRLSIGVTGLQNSQYALNTTAHNLTNTQTTGYTRQQVLLTDRPYTNFAKNSSVTSDIGRGVVTAEVRHVRDTFSDNAYRVEHGRLNYYKAHYETVTEIEGYFGELEGQDFNTTLNNLWLSLQEMQKEANSIVTRSSFIANSQAFLERAQEIRTDLITYQRNLNLEIKNQVDRINELASNIAELNKSILACEASGIENASDYRDARIVALDELGGLIKTDVVQNSDGTIEVYAEGALLVSKGITYKMETIKVAESEEYQRKYPFTNDATDFLMPVWAADQSAVINIDKLSSTRANTDLGSLKGLLCARGYFVSDYSDVPVKPEKPVAENYENDADYQLAMSDYKKEMDEYTEKLDYYSLYVEPYTITNTMSQLDVLVHSVVTGINDILCPNKEVTLIDGSRIKILDEEAAGIGMGKSNDISGTELFVRKSTPRYTEKEITLADGTTIMAQVYNEEDENDFYSMYSSANLKINEDLQVNPSLLPLTKVNSEEAQEVVDAMLALWNKKHLTAGPSSLVECNFKDFYATIIDDLGDRGYTYNAMAESEQQTLTDIENLRQQVSGVSSDEELSNLIKFQQAYNASSRYVNVVSEMIEHIINTLGA